MALWWLLSWGSQSLDHAGKFSLYSRATSLVYLIHIPDIKQYATTSHINPQQQTWLRSERRQWPPEIQCPALVVGDQGLPLHRQIVRVSDLGSKNVARWIDGATRGHLRRRRCLRTTCSHVWDSMSRNDSPSVCVDSSRWSADSDTACPDCVAVTFTWTHVQCSFYITPSPRLCVNALSQ